LLRTRSAKVSRHRDACRAWSTQGRRRSGQGKGPHRDGKMGVGSNFPLRRNWERPLDGVILWSSTFQRSFPMFDGSPSEADPKVPLKPGKLIEATRELRSLIAEYDARGDEIRAMSADIDGNAREVVALEAERRAMVPLITELRRQ